MFGFCDFATLFQGYSLGKRAKSASHFENWVTWLTAGKRWVIRGYRDVRFL
jgi:hypothetical protein